MYTRSVMVMPVSETALEELLSRVRCNLLQVALSLKLRTICTAVENPPVNSFITGKAYFQPYKLLVSHYPHNTAIAPKSTTVLGCIYSEGKLSTSPQRTPTLSTCSQATTVKALPSFLGAYKFIGRLIPNCSSFLSALEILIADKTSQSDIMWTEDMSNIFCRTQQHLHNHKSHSVSPQSKRSYGQQTLCTGSRKTAEGSILPQQQNSYIPINCKLFRHQHSTPCWLIQHPFRLRKQKRTRMPQHKLPNL